MTDQYLAQFKTVCAACELLIHPGQPIRHDEDLDAWVHVTCPADQSFAKPQGAPCPRCTSYHPGEC